MADGQNSDEHAVETLGLTAEGRAWVKSRVATNNVQDATDPVVSAMVGATNGIMYGKLCRNLETVPIPEIKALVPHCDLMLDLGCNWGRWCLSAGQSGIRTIGLDPSLGAVLAARRLANKLGLESLCAWVVGDARFPPFASKTFDTVFSYSVLQHFAQSDAEQTIKRASNILKPNGVAVIQLANAHGLRSIYHQIMRQRAPTEFDVRYWKPSEMKAAFLRHFEFVRLKADGFFGLGMRPEDAPLLGGWRAISVKMSGRLVELSRRVPRLTSVADSVFVYASNSK